ncbi:hypothetical protein H4582DRAFT_2172292 [Lactarius indigo]|nr:hypothetical protein H4582DRAFT_2172292 [Lactarius indigo]
MKDEWAADIWREACAKTRVNFDPSMRSELFVDSTMKLFIDAKKRAIVAIEIFYGFDTIPTSDSISNHATLAQELLSERSFVHIRPNLNPPQHPYRHIIECCIDEWSDGTLQETRWDEEWFKIAYRSHVGSLDDFQKLGTAQGYYDSLEHIRSSLLKRTVFPSTSAPRKPPTEFKAGYSWLSRAHAPTVLFTICTPRKLTRFDGKDGGRILLAISGTVYDVTSGRGFLWPRYAKPGPELENSAG